jgi:hypothetical protein
MKTSEHPLELDELGEPVVRSAIEAKNSGDKKRWYRYFSDSPAFTDDGISHDFTEWCEAELFGASPTYLVSIDGVEDAGLTIYGNLHSDRWRDFKTFLRFRVEVGKVTGLAVGETDH